MERAGRMGRAMRDDKRWLELLESVGAVQNGHFLLSSGRHSERYVQCAKVLEDPEHAAAVGSELALQMPSDVDRVMSPPLGGILVGYEVARGLRRPFQFPERGTDGLFQLRRGFSIHPGERMFVSKSILHRQRPGASRFYRVDGEHPDAGAAAVNRAINTMALRCDAAPDGRTNLLCLNYVDMGLGSFPWLYNIINHNFFAPLYGRVEKRLRRQTIVQ